MKNEKFYQNKYYPQRFAKSYNSDTNDLYVIMFEMNFYQPILVSSGQNSETIQDATLQQMLRTHLYKETELKPTHDLFDSEYYDHTSTQHLDTV